MHQKCQSNNELEKSIDQNRQDRSPDTLLKIQLECGFMNECKDYVGDESHVS